MNSQEFYIVLPSNVYTYKDTNTLSTFKTRLKKRLNFPQNEDWRVGLSEIFYTKSWFNIKNDFNIKYIAANGIHLDISADDSNYNMANDLKIYAGEYTITFLLKAINEKFKKSEKIFISLPHIEVNEVRQIVRIKPGVLKQFRLDGLTHTNLKCVPHLGEEVENILGIIDNKHPSILERMKSWENEIEWFDKGYFKGFRTYDMTAGFHSIYVYTDIIEDSFVGDQNAPILRVIPPQKTKWGEICSEGYLNPHYIPLRKRNFDTIEIALKDDTGNPIKFEQGRTIVKLIFKNFSQESRPNAG